MPNQSTHLKRPLRWQVARKGLWCLFNLRRLLKVGVVVGVGGMMVGCGGGGSPASGGGGSLNFDMPTNPPAVVRESLANFNVTSTTNPTNPPSTTGTIPPSGNMGGGSVGGRASGDTPGGAGRISNVMVDDRPAIVSVVTSQNIAELLADPDGYSKTKLLGRDPMDTTKSHIFNFNGNPRPYITVTNKRQEPFSPGTNVPSTSAVLGYTYRFQYSDAPLDFMQVYIDRRARVALGHELLGGADFQIVTIGEIAPENLPSGEYTYSGYAVVASPMQNNPLRPTHGNFKMDVDFNSNKVTSFEAELESNDLVTMKAVTNSDGNKFDATEIRIDASTGSFDGDINFTNSEADTNMRLRLSNIKSDSRGSIYGQFHGNQAIGVTGVFHSTPSTDPANPPPTLKLLGGFAGAKN